MISIFDGLFDSKCRLGGCDVPRECPTLVVRPLLKKRKDVGSESE